MDLLDRAEHRRRHHPAARQHLRDPGVLREAVVDRRPQHQHRALRVVRARRVHEPSREAVDQHHQQLVLAAHVPVGRHRGHAELAREPAHRERLDALGVEQPDRRVEHGFAIDRRWATPAALADPPPGGGSATLRHLLTCILIRMAHGTPTLATGKICYLEIPASRRRALVALLPRRVRLGAAHPRRRRDRIRRRGQGGERLVGHRPAAVG